MPHTVGFDNDKYIELQTKRIRERIDEFGGKLYLEFGGKLFDDYHASRVLPGFKPDTKLSMLSALQDDVEIILAINANDIERSKVRGDLGITYDEDLLRLMDAFINLGFYVSSVVITQYGNQPNADLFRQRLDAMGVKSYLHYPIEGYPHDIAHIVSDEGYGKNDYVETSRPLVVVTAPGPGSGKMATCLSQLYHENKRGVKAGYAKFETFPIWNLPLDHPVNIAYEAATVDLDDVNAIDPFHLAAYGETTVNYNRDIEIFPVLKAMLEHIQGESPYQSPTDMGVNMAGFAIVDDDAVRAAAKNEIVRRYFQTAEEVRRTGVGEDQVSKLEILMKKAGVDVDVNPAHKAALDKAEETGEPAGAIELADGRVITGRTSGHEGPGRHPRRHVHHLRRSHGPDCAPAHRSLGPRKSPSAPHRDAHRGFDLFAYQSHGRPRPRPPGRAQELRRLLLDNHYVRRRAALPHAGHQRLLRTQIRIASLLPRISARTHESSPFLIKSGELC